MQSLLQNPREKYWNRMLLNAFWVILLVYFAGQLLILLVMGNGRLLISESEYIHIRMVLPDSMILMLLLLLEGIYRWKPSFSEISIIAASHVYAMIIILHISPDVAVEQFILLMPLLVSMIYLKSCYLIGSSVICLIYSAVLFGTGVNYSYIEYTENIIIITIFAGTSLAGFAIIGRGRDLIQSLENSEKSEQDLRIQNIIMDRLSKIDPLTDLYNHKTFHEYLGWLIEHQQSNPFPMQLAVLDIDNFKQVNDRFGHWVGDIVLKHVASVVLKHIYPDDFAARYGGEEFVVILNAKSFESSHEIMETIRAEIAGHPIEEMEGQVITVSIGMHDFAGADSKSYVFQKADDALYEAKKSGKNRIVAL
ncbi:GGDEF domain-containing protein [Paenibacillus sp. GCM10012306]|uniref:GGDEF domain-containing protein n=1 Tax=Paenibacillus sp. GCM10012306 TaxID=3317342 RepID=UPI00360C4C4E